MKHFKFLLLIILVLTGCNANWLFSNSSGSQSNRFFEVSWLNWDGSTISREKVREGETPVFNGQTPEKESTTGFDYSFEGWNPTPAPIHKSTKYTAVFSSTAKYCSVIWKNWDGKIIYVERCVCGETPSFKTERYSNPTKPSDERYDYEFVDWSPSITSITEDQTYTAVFDEKVRNYEVTWLNWDKSLLYKTRLPYGATPSYPGETPTRSSNTQYRYTFSGWYPHIATVTGDVTYTAQYSNSLRTYTVQWLNYDGSVLCIDRDVSYGTTPSYSGDTPTKPSTAYLDYVFSGWSPSIAQVSGDISYWAQFESTVRLYAIQWLDYDGTVLKVDNLEYGSKPNYSGPTPTRDGDKQYSYTFLGWSPVIARVTENATYTAVYSNQLNKYEIKWVNWDGSTLQSSYVEYGKIPSYSGDTPTKDSTVQYTYSFKAWSPKIVPVTDDTVYVALFEENIRCYNVIWKNYDGTVIKTDVMSYGSTPTYVGETPTRKPDGEFKYEFSGWSPEITVVEQDTIYVAQYNSLIKDYYTITWCVLSGYIVEQYTYGDIPSYKGSIPIKEPTAIYTYEFSGWSPAITAVTCDKSYYPTFTQKDRFYSITWKNWDGSVLDKEQYKYNVLPSFKNGTPAREATAQYTFTFSNWSPTITQVKKDATYTANYSNQVRKYTITWQNWDGEVLEVDEEKVYGTTPTYDGETPTKERTLEDNDFYYVFAGWSPTVGKVEGEVTYVAQFSREYLFEFYATSSKTYTLLKCLDNTISFVTLPTTYRGIDVTGINRYSFYNCTKLKTIVIPESMSNYTGFENGNGVSTGSVIGTPTIFKGCSNLKSVYFPYFYGIYGFDNIAYPATEAIYYGNQTEFRTDFFQESPRYKIVLPPTVTSISNWSSTSSYLFNQQKDITINHVIFTYYTNIQESVAHFWKQPVSYPANLTFYGEFDFGKKVIYNGHEVYRYLKFFSGNNTGFGLKNVTFADGLKNVPEGLFSNDTLENIFVGDECSYYTSVDGVLYNKEKTELVACPEGKTGTIALVDSTESVFGSAFMNCSNLSTIRLSNVIKSIGSNAFWGCSAMIEYRGSRENWLTVTGKENLINYILYFDSSANSNITTPDNIAVIDDYSFYRCTSIRKVTLSPNVTKIGKYSFANCPYLNTININQGCQIIDQYAFTGCTSLKSVLIPKSMKRLESSCFENCTLFYEGTDEDYRNMTYVSPEVLQLMYFYSENQPSSTGYWHYVDGVPTIW